MPEGSPQAYEQAKLAETRGVSLDYEDLVARRMHEQANSVLYDANRFQEVLEGHPNTIGDLQATSEKIIAEHEAAKAEAAKEGEPGKLWKGIKVAGFGALWVVASFGQTMRPAEQAEYRHPDRSNPDL